MKVTNKFIPILAVQQDKCFKSDRGVKHAGRGSSCLIAQLSERMWIVRRQIVVVCNVQMRLDNDRHYKFMPIKCNYMSEMVINYSYSKGLINIYTQAVLYVPAKNREQARF